MQQSAAGATGGSFLGGPSAASLSEALHRAQDSSVPAAAPTSAPAHDDEPTAGVGSSVIGVDGNPNLGGAHSSSYVNSNNNAHHDADGGDSFHGGESASVAAATAAALASAASNADGGLRRGSMSSVTSGGGLGRNVSTGSNSGRTVVRKSVSGSGGPSGGLMRTAVAQNRMSMHGSSAPRPLGVQLTDAPMDDD